MFSFCRKIKHTVRARGRFAVGKVWIGVDGGGSQTRAYRFDEDGTVVSTALAGPANGNTVGLEIALANVSSVIATVSPPSSGSELSLVLGLAGATNLHVREFFLQHLENAFPKSSISLYHDGEIAVYGVGMKACGLLIAGTGSLASGLTVEGRFVRRGGYGPLLGDQGSAYQLGLQALRHSVLAAEGMAEATILVENLLQSLGATNFSEVVPLIYGGPLDRSAIARLAEQVLVAYSMGDGVARNLVTQSITANIILYGALQQALSVPEPILGLAGGLFASQTYRQLFLERWSQSLSEPVFADDWAIRGLRYLLMGNR